MKLLFITSYLSIHTIQLFENIIDRGNVNFLCVECEEETEERKKMHYKKHSLNIECVNFNFFKKLPISKQHFDIIIVSDFSDLHYVSKLDASYFLFMSEHVNKKKSLKNLLVTVKRFLVLFFLFKKNKSFVLCNSSFAGREYAKAFFKRNHIYKFGYFPQISSNQRDSVKNNSILWSGRLLDWKHPETAIFAISELQKYNQDYKLTIVGNGPEEQNLKKMIKSKNINNVVMLDFLDRESLIELMSKSEIYLFSSDKGEGWGVVLNEALSNGCITFANQKAGSTNFLIRDGYNGFKYSNKKELKQKIDNYIRLSAIEKLNLSYNAKNTIKELWNVGIAAERLYNLMSELLTHKAQKTEYIEGPVSYYFDKRKK